MQKTTILVNARMEVEQLAPVLANPDSATSFYRSSSPVSKVSCKAAALLIFLPQQDRVTGNKEEQGLSSFKAFSTASTYSSLEIRGEQGVTK